MMTLYTRPARARGLLPLIMGALSVGKAAYGAIEANQEKQRNKGYINDAYRSAKSRMGTSQAAGMQGNAEALAARGMLDAGAQISPIKAAMLNGSSGASSLGGQSQANLAREYGLDRHALDAQHERDLNENQAGALNAQIGAIAGGISGVAQAYTGAQEAGMYQGAAGAGSATPTPSMTMSGDVSPIKGAFNIHPIAPFDHPDSAWNPKNQTIDGTGMINSQFNSSL